MRGKTAIKSIILAMLILLSILQIEKLWFDNSSSHSFFRYIPQKQDSEAAFQELILEPEFIAVYQAEIKGEYYELDAAGILFNAILKDTNKLIRRLPQMTMAEYSYENLFDKPHILCRFSVPISGAVIRRIAQSAKAEEDFQAYSMAILPSGLEENRFRLVFYGEDTGRSMGFSVSKTELSEENEVFGGYIANKTMIGDDLLLSAKEQELPGFEGEVLLPAQKQNYILPQEWKKELSFLKIGVYPAEIDTDKLSEYLFSYVKNPKILWNILEKERVRYGDSSVLMEYTTKGVFTYRFIQDAAKGAADLPAGEALKKVLDFMKKDNLLGRQEIKLAQYSRDGETHTFFFDYYFRGHPLIWDEDFRKEYQTQYPLEVIVKKDQVILYRRVLLQSDYLLQQGTRFQVNYEDVLNAFYQKQGRGKVKDLYLGYFSKGNQIRLGWVVETEEVQYLYPLRSEVKNELE